jgi:hypothetical protein
VVVEKGGDLRFLMTKKPARVAERNIRISLNGHIVGIICKF